MCEGRRDPEGVRARVLGAAARRGQTRAFGESDSELQQLRELRGLLSGRPWPSQGGQGSGVRCGASEMRQGALGQVSTPHWPRLADGVPGVTCQSSCAGAQHKGKPASSPGPSGKGWTAPRMERQSQARSDCAGLDLNSFLAWQAFLER